MFTEATGIGVILAGVSLAVVGALRIYRNAGEPHGARPPRIECPMQVDLGLRHYGEIAIAKVTILHFPEFS